MTPSIRTFLLLNLLLSVILITSLAIIGNLYFSHKDIQDHLDTELLMSGLRLQSVITSETNKSELKKIQQKLNALPQQAEYYRKQSKLDKYMKTFGRIQFQVVDTRNRQIILHSAGAPIKNLYRYRTGFFDVWLDNHLWRSFTTHLPNSHLAVVVAERQFFRNKLEAKITRDSILIMLITSPFLGLLIWIIVGQALDSLRKVTKEVAYRAPSYLKPVDLHAVPAEISPLVNELNKLLLRVDQAFEREKRFAMDAAHELRTPLAALKAQTQVALKACNDEERITALNKVLAGVDRSTHVVQQLLTLSRMGPKAKAMKKIPVDLIKVAREVIAELVPTADKKQTEIELTSATKSPMIKSDPTAISILLRNLIDNAIRYTPAHSKVEVIIETNPKFVLLKVIDNGPGIPEELRQRVFERFYRMLGTQARGSGLGLGIVQQIAQAHHAIVSLDRAPSGQGLQVTLQFPIK